MNNYYIFDAIDLIHYLISPSMESANPKILLILDLRISSSVQIVATNKLMIMQMAHPSMAIVARR